MLKLLTFGVYLSSLTLSGRAIRGVASSQQAAFPCLFDESESSCYGDSWGRRGGNATHFWKRAESGKKTSFLGSLFNNHQGMMQHRNMTPMLAGIGASVRAFSQEASGSENPGQNNVEHPKIVVTEESTHLTIYAGQAVVSQSMAAKLPMGLSAVQVQPDFEYWDLNTLQLVAEGDNTVDTPESIFWRRSVVERNELMKQLIGQNIELSRSGRESPLSGELLAWQNDMGILRLPNGGQEIFQWSDGLSVRSAKAEGGSQVFSPTLNAIFRLQQAAEQMGLTYLNRGVRYNNQYRIVTNPDNSSLDVALSAHLINHSSTDYSNASLQLVSGDTGQTDVMVRKASAYDSAEPHQRVGDALFMQIPGRYSLPAGGELSLAVAKQSSTGYENSYRYSFYGKNASGRKAAVEHPVRELAFVARSDFPAGAVQLLEAADDGTLKLIYQGSISQTAAEQPVTLSLGQAYTVSVQRERLAVRQLGEQREADWQLKITNSQNQEVTVWIDDMNHNLINMELIGEGLQRADRSVTIPAGETRTVTLTNTYYQN